MFKYLLPLFISITAKAQHLAAFADSIRTAYHIPALGYTVLSADSVYEIKMLGNKRGSIPATLQDKFRIFHWQVLGKERSRGPCDQQYR